MPIKKVDVFPLSYPEPNDHDNTRFILLVRLETHDGFVGWGESITQFRPATLATATLIEAGLADVVIGRDPLENEKIWHDLRREVWWYGDTGGIAAFAISALDMALWDVKGKILGQPVYKLLGGKQHEKLPVCATTHPRATEISALAEELAGHIANGYQLVKVGLGRGGHSNLGYNAHRDVAFVKAVREAIGPEAGFIVDVGSWLFWDLPYAVRMAQAFLPYNLTWLEDVFHPDNLQSYSSLRQAVPEMPLALGERFWNKNDYQRLLQADICDVILIDPGRAEGITGMHRLTQIAALHHIRMDPHSWSSAVNTAASIHVSFANANSNIIELKPCENPMQHELVSNPFSHQNGWIYPPEGPGLGIDVVEDVVRKYQLC